MKTTKLIDKETLASLFGVAVLATFTHQAIGAQQCYEFNSFAVNVNHQIGDTIVTPYGAMTVREFHVTTGVPSNSPVQFVEVSPTNIALGASAPELHTYLANFQVLPSMSLTRVTLSFAEATSVNLPIANLEVNGDRRVYNGLAQALPQANQDRLGANGNFANVSVNWMPPSGNGNFNRGTLELTALPGQYINTFGFGGDQHFFDNLCLTN